MKTQDYCYTASNMYRMCTISAILFATLTSYTATVTAEPITQCNEVKQAYLSMGYSALDVPASSIIAKDNELQICPAGFSCCTRDMEIQLTAHSRTTFDDRLIAATEPAKRKLVLATAEVHAFFTQQIAKAERETDEMFTRAYDKQYKENKEVFDELFNDFRKYYSGKELDIPTFISKFFKGVFVRMFNLQNPKFNFTESYLTCVGNKMDTIAPFGAYPERLQRSLQQALVASRTFIQGLAIGRSVAITMQKVQPTIACTKAHMKMNFCSHCRGLPTLKPCANYCLNVMKGCLAYHSELDQSWQKYTDAMDALALRLSGDGTFNLESVLGPLKDQLSMAVMEYHQNSPNILHRAMDNKTGCGQPEHLPSRVKKDVNSLRTLGGTIPLRSRKSTSLSNLVDGVKDILKEVKHLWTHTVIAGNMCSAISATSNQKCWNGETEAKYSKSLVGDGLKANKNNPEVAVNSSTPDSTIEKQVIELQEITKRVINATLGVGNVGWVELQLPLPNITSTIGEGRSVKSDGRLVAPLSGAKIQTLLRADTGSGSGFKGISDDDDEDTVKYSGTGSNLNWPPKIPITSPVTGSGNGAENPIDVTPTKEENIRIVTSPLVPRPNLGANQEVKGEEQTKTTPGSSSNSVLSSFTVITLSSLLVYSLRWVAE